MFARFAIIVGATLGVAVAAPEVVPHVTRYLASTEKPAVAPVRAPAPAVTVARPTTPRRTTGRKLIIEADRSGHFTVAATVSGRKVDLLVDTGATIVALNEATARKLGIFLRDADYRKVVSTANGMVPAAPVVLPALRVGGIRVRDVEAVVIAGEALPINLLGMSFLGRLSQFEMARGRLVLAQ